jgi:hypothetical protein
MREARIGSRPREEPADSRTVRRSPIARLWGGLLDWRRRDADRTIACYAPMVGEAADLYRVYEAEAARPAPDAAFDKTDARRRGIVASDCA